MNLFLKVKQCKDYNALNRIVNDYIDYYNKDRYQWNLAKLSPSEYYKYCITGEYPNNYR